jgi:lipoic acid synthetase
MKVRAPSADSLYGDVRRLLHGQHLHTVCEEAHCPNVGECWGRGTAAFQILGDTCTRACRYCNVHSGKPEGPPDPDEPRRLAETAAQMKLGHIVVTSVDRDDLPDRGAAQFAATIRALKELLPGASVEVLTPDFAGYEEEALALVLAEQPEVFNHNIETVRRLHRRMRGAKASYDGSLRLLARAKEVAACAGTASRSSPSASTCSRLPSTRRSSAGCTRTSSAPSAISGAISASARSSRRRWFAPATAPRSSWAARSIVAAV